MSSVEFFRPATRGPANRVRAKHVSYVGGRRRAGPLVLRCSEFWYGCYVFRAGPVPVLHNCLQPGPCGDDFHRQAVHFQVVALVECDDDSSTLARQRARLRQACEFAVAVEGR